MSRFRFTEKTRLSTGVLGLATLGLWMTACSPAENTTSNGTGTGGRGTGGAGPSSGGSTAVGESGGTTGTGGPGAGRYGRFQLLEPQVATRVRLARPSPVMPGAVSAAAAGAAAGKMELLAVR